MDHCAVCQTPIPSGYYRLGNAIACATCVGIFQTTETANAGKYLRRGLLFAFGAFVISALVLWGMDEVATLAGTLGAFLRGGTMIAAGGVIGSAAKDGAKKRGSRTLQIASVVLTYMAWCLALAATAAGNVPQAQRSSGLVGGLLVLAPVLPFMVALKNPEALTGIVVICIACAGAWRASEGAELVSGPF